MYTLKVFLLFCCRVIFFIIILVKLAYMTSSKKLCTLCYFNWISRHPQGLGESHLAPQEMELPLSWTCGLDQTWPRWKNDICDLGACGPARAHITEKWSGGDLPPRNIIRNVKCLQTLSQSSTIFYKLSNATKFWTKCNV